MNFFQEVPRPEDSQLPMSYYIPKQDHIMWFCDYDQDCKITSVFFNKKEQEKKCHYIDSEAVAISMRDALVGAGWRVMPRPKIQVNLAPEKQAPRRVRRAQEKEERKLKKKEGWTNKQDGTEKTKEEIAEN